MDDCIASTNARRKRSHRAGITHITSEAAALTRPGHSESLMPAIAKQGAERRSNEPGTDDDDTHPASEQFDRNRDDLHIAAP